MNKREATKSVIEDATSARKLLLDAKRQFISGEISRSGDSFDVALGLIAKCSDRAYRIGQGCYEDN